MTEFEKMVSGEPFDGIDPSISAVRKQADILKHKINNSMGEPVDGYCRELFGSFGEESWVTPPFLCEFGKTIHIGSKTFLNMGVTMLDNAEIHIGDNVLIGPNTQFYTASHSLDHRSRRRWETYSKPIVIEDDVWVGGQVVICQGVTIGARSVVAANSTVTKDVPPDCLVAGSPAKVVKQIPNESE
ncbi:sugar O-acetyltransferase [Photobacterium sanctipauli]|uniref:Nodulation protein L n=1 Tax=Photobacterium sanctipauli TaxID=1342794 RepID=A0A2T3P0Y8_9GAMM|nr:sugar O-acetyltransferase [Photobacterium sanctipauli]PSW22142.1 sugar O-acetyltransferase [Photobacterium sanctipauli]